jgi:metal-responsive CopG/Arc/MetJ family transcriptional regulator
MKALSIHLPNKLADASQQAAKELGISRTEFIRRAVVHELQVYRQQREEQAITKAFKVMEASPTYTAFSFDLDEDDDLLPDEKDQWWKGD